MAAHENGPDTRQVLERELRYHEELYSGFAQKHFARPAVRALRRNMVRRILRQTRMQPSARVLSIGCGIGDTELLLAPHAGHVTCLDLSPAAVRQGRADAEQQEIRNVEFVEGTSNAVGGQKFDAVIAIFFLHHLPDPAGAISRRAGWVAAARRIVLFARPQRESSVGQGGPPAGAEADGELSDR
ncbi:MAG: class I SAM-dependent methyltransferase [Paludibaculum sp.]